ncbi:hypothetical protein HYS54_00090 [Candidatus Micrarchaeota archaeon]|nr:hypothetical protein [Candidatus Micrarchaeota archaeon]
MEFREALKAALRESRNTLGKEGYFPNSGLCVFPAGSFSAECWIVTFFHPAFNKVVQASVSGGGVEFKPPATPIKPSTTEIKPSQIRSSSSKVFEKALSVFRESKLPLSQVILTVDSRAWHANFVTKSLQVVIIDLDLSGKVISSRTELLTREPVGLPS